MFPNVQNTAGLMTVFIQPPTWKMKALTVVIICWCQIYLSLRCSVLKVTLKDTWKYVLARGCDYHNFVHRLNQAADHQASIFCKTAP